jgi:hypothetical protein
MQTLETMLLITGLVVSAAALRAYFVGLKAGRHQ